MSTHNICFHAEIKKNIIWISRLIWSCRRPISVGLCGPVRSSLFAWLKMECEAVQPGLCLHLLNMSEGV